MAHSLQKCQERYFVLRVKHEWEEETSVITSLVESKAHTYCSSLGLGEEEGTLAEKKG